MKKKAVFFLRSYNSIDHMVPVIYKLTSRKTINITIILTESQKSMQDYRIQFLRKFKAIKIYNVNDKNLSNRHGAKDKNSKQIFYSVLGKIEKTFMSILKKSGRNEISYKHIMENLFDNAEKGIVVFDWLTLGKKKVNFVRPILREAEKMSIPHICLPHGDCPYYNKMFKKNAINYENIGNWINTPFERIVVPNKLCARRYIHHKSVENIKILGSPRYNEEWLKILSGLTPDYNNENAKDKLKIVFFLRKPDNPVFWDEVERTIDIIAQFKEIYLVVKTHTGGVDRGSSDIFNKKHPGLDKSKIHSLKFVYDEIHSGSLIKWADVILDLGTSVVFEAIRIGKPVLALDYLHPNISTSGHYLKSTVLHCRDDLYDEMKALIIDPKRRLYSEKERIKFVDEMIDFPDSNVLERYVQTIEDIIA